MWTPPQDETPPPTGGMWTPDPDDDEERNDHDGIEDDDETDYAGHGGGMDMSDDEEDEDDEQDDYAGHGGSHGDMGSDGVGMADDDDDDEDPDDETDHAGHGSGQGGMDMSDDEEERNDHDGIEDDDETDHAGHGGGMDMSDDAEDEDDEQNDHAGHGGGMDMSDDEEEADDEDHASHGGSHSGGHSDIHSGDSHGGAPAIAPPGIGASQAEINQYINALNAQGEGHVHGMGDARHAEHMAAMDLVPRSDADVVAIGDGDWFDASTWSTGRLPQPGDSVLIPEGVSVHYDEVSNTELFTVRVDGELTFDTSDDSRIIFDTMVVTHTGRVEIGTLNDPVDEDTKVELIIADNGPINTNWDPMLLSRGVLTHGETVMVGAAKDSHLKVTEDPMAGDTSLTFAETPEGWQVGDTIVIAGTNYDGYNWDSSIGGKRLYQPEDEIRQISAIEGNTVYFDGPLVHDHDAPRDDLKTSVANYTRNISIETQNADQVEIHERGHTMFMHSDSVDVRYVEFHELGRTDKSEASFDISDIDNVRSDSNVQGRYAVHFHRTGTDDQSNPAVLEGSAVWGSPGWGIVHHDSHALITNNATYDTFGAGYVAETGNETGAWNDNIAIWAQGISWADPKNSTEISRTEFDTANSGDGFWFQGRLVDSQDNVAASVNTGFVYFHRDGDNRMIETPADNFDYPDALYGATVRADDTPILEFSGNEAFAAKEGLHVVKANPNQGHDVWSHLDGFTAWNVEDGAHLEYTSHYLLTDFDVVGKEQSGFSKAGTGITIGNNTTEIVIEDSSIDGFNVGINMGSKFVGDTLAQAPTDGRGYVVVDTEITDTQRDYIYSGDGDRIINNSNALPDREIGLKIDGPLTFKETSNWFTRVVDIEGTKTDGLGTTKFPAGTDDFDMRQDDVIRTLENDGYWTTSSGQRVFLVDLYLTDRATGDIYYETHPVYLDNNVPVGNSGAGYGGAKYNGVSNFETRGGVTYFGGKPLDVAIPAPEPEEDFDIMAILTEGHGVHDDSTPYHDHGHMDDDDDLMVA